VDGELAGGRHVDCLGQQCVALSWFLAPVLVSVVRRGLEGDHEGAGFLTERSECRIDFSCIVCGNQCGKEKTKCDYSVYNSKFEISAPMNNKKNYCPQN
jgi:hypothetical protein